MSPDAEPPTNDHGIAGAGRWCGIAGELPCAVISLLLVGQTLGEAVGGLQGAITGAIIGALTGLIFGAYSTYLTIQHLERVEMNAQARRSYVPPMEEILEKPEFLREREFEE
ncbi:MAG TPA: hypothetical protein ENG31_04085 [Candidatus Thorarchaeota archaeon]|nr:MAG: hypothetical protein DRO93_06670 [Candidatus Thorarchaeota archaeon]HDD67777.1 hypothetical protein [Candidatus Thorarchaeota archaeon]